MNISELLYQHFSPGLSCLRWRESFHLHPTQFKMVWGSCLTVCQQQLDCLLSSPAYVTCREGRTIPDSWCPGSQVAGWPVLVPLPSHSALYAHFNLLSTHIKILVFEYITVTHPNCHLLPGMATPELLRQWYYHKMMMERQCWMWGRVGSTRKWPATSWRYGRI